MKSDFKPIPERKLESATNQCSSSCNIAGHFLVLVMLRALGLTSNMRFLKAKIYTGHSVYRQVYVYIAKCYISPRLSAAFGIFSDCECFILQYFGR
jgi:hypothetical protein